MIIRVRNVCGLKGFISNPSRIILLRDDNYFFRIASSYFFSHYIFVMTIIPVTLWKKTKEVPIFLKYSVREIFIPKEKKMNENKNDTTRRDSYNSVTIEASAECPAKYLLINIPGLLRLQSLNSRFPNKKSVSRVSVS